MAILKLSSSLRGILLMLAAMAMFTLNDLIMKVAAVGLGEMQVLAVRGIFASLVVLLVLVASGQGRRITDAAKPLVMLRSLFETIAAICYIAALTRFPIGDVVAITQTYPLMLLPVGIVLFGERLSRFQAALALGGFIGALMIAKPGAAGFDPRILIAFGTALALVGRDSLSAYLPRGLSPLAVTLSIVAGPMIGGWMGVAFGEWHPMSSWQFTQLAISGIALALAHGLIFMAFQAAPMRDVAPFAYAATLFAAIAGFVVFGDHPSLLTQIGMVLLVICGALLAAKARPS